MNSYYFRLVCVDEQNPIQYSVLEDETIESLEDVHKFIEDHLYSHTPELTKWMLIPVRKDSIKIR